MLPVMNHRETLGHAKTRASAERLIRKAIDVPKGFKLRVWKRDTRMADILGLPVAWVYSVSYGA